ncbi:MAG: hypothetical protein WCT05_07975 [Lentisphaeria bacterium]
MKVRILHGGQPAEMQPISCCSALADLPLGGKSLKQHLEDFFQSQPAASPQYTLTLHPALWPSKTIQQQLAAATQPCHILSEQLGLLAWLSVDGLPPAQDSAILLLDSESIQIRYPWDLLHVCENLIGALHEDRILGSIRERVTYDGHLELGEGSVILPGVYIEGNVYIGKNCKIGPNCYIRGNTSIGDHCHIGQAVEIKNSLLMDKVSIGHLSYVGDSIICPGSNFGAGTIIANLRHDGKNHRSQVGDTLVDSGRRKLGAIIGAGVHTGINTSINAGRKIWPGLCTRPGEIVCHDLHPDTAQEKTGDTEALK